MMSSQQQIEFFAKNSERSAAGIAIARSSGNYFLASTNLKQRFKNHLMHGLIKWRHGLGSPEQEIGLAISGSHEACKMLLDLNPAAPISGAYPIATAAILSSLIYSSPDSFLISLVEADSIEMNSAEISIENSLALALANPSSTPTLRTAISLRPNNAFEGLAKLTHENYLSILDSKSENQIKGNVQLAESLFLRRKNDSYYVGGIQYYGGGSDNSHVIDFMLAAALKQRGVNGLSHHEWRWA